MEKLSPLAVTKQAYLFVFSDFKRLLKFIWPFLIIEAISNLVPSLSLNQIKAGANPLGGEFGIFLSVTGIFYIYFWIVFCISWTRLILLPSDQAKLHWRLSGRFWRMLKYSIVIPLCGAALLFAFVIILNFLPKNLIPNGLTHDVIMFTCMSFAMAIVFLKFGFVFPSSAIDEKTSLSQSMDISEDATLRVAFTALMLIGIFLPLKFLPGLIYLTGTAPSQSVSAALQIFSIISSTLGTAVFITGWALIYDWGRKRISNMEAEQTQAI